ncbi:poly [ADP-ribose] polymerase-like [Contarinia nasturtii]|uniref:poly [ADP-ribose] polymerase-like n=1 Tax=Contarinia nasturtii TaxID=265458 RepID=UPI0012D3E7B2|nr:poly [ADP-ribose] polymerase-like [Contarinia nasturtii]
MIKFLPYQTEYAKGNTSCNKCQQNIRIDTVQIGVNQHNTKDDCMDARWFDMPCFFQIRRPGLEDFIDGFANLRYHDQMKIRTFLGVDNNVPSTSTAQRPRTKSESLDLTLEERIKKQNHSFFEIYDKLNTLKDVELVDILEIMHQFVPERRIDKLNHACDVICFGALSPCSVCYTGKLVFRNSMYRCTGYDSAWTRCLYSTKEPRRVPIKLPRQFQQEFFVKNFEVQTRILRNITEFNMDEFEQYTKQPLFGMEFFIIGKTKNPRNVVEQKIRAMGGQLASAIRAGITAVISNADVVNKGDGEILWAFILRIRIISDELLEKVLEHDPIDLFVKNDLSKWSKDSNERKTISKTSEISKRCDNKANGQIKYDRVYCDLAVRYEVMLNFVDSTMNKNSFFKLQLVESDQLYNNLMNYHVLETKGRIITNSSGHFSQKKYSNLDEAKGVFKQIYLKMTGNEFGTNRFEKKPGKYNLVKIDNDYLHRHVEKNNVSTKLSESLYELMQLVFFFCEDVMKSTLLAYCFDDYKNMPLGKIHKTRIEDALICLGEILSMVSSGDSHKIMAASNQFYSYFPHDCGLHPPPLINTYEMVQQKIDMLHHMLQKEIDYNTLIMDTERNCLDVCYEHLEKFAKITMLNKSSEMYAHICNYINNTQLHNDSTAKYDPGPFDVDEVFEVVRHEELMRYKPHEKNSNRLLLFHGSPIENFFGILKNGLKVQPAEARFNGSVFGKGIYFADSVTKSARYCHPINETGLVLLCEVAAGISDIRYYTNNSKWMDDCESVQAIGQWKPESIYVRHDGLKIPNGKLVERPEKAGIVFNEFVVFDESRVKVRYLVKLKFTDTAI